MAPMGQKGSYQSFVTISSTDGRAIGPVIGGAIAKQMSNAYLYIVIIILLGVSAFIFHCLLKHVGCYLIGEGMHMKHCQN